MLSPSLTEAHVPDEVLLRQLGRRPAEDKLPESHTWQVYCELRRRGNEHADKRFVESVRSLHRRRSMGGSSLPTNDDQPSEHKMVDDPVLAADAATTPALGARGGGVQDLVDGLEGHRDLLADVLQGHRGWCTDAGRRVLTRTLAAGCSHGP